MQSIYQFPLLIQSKRFLLSENPFIYAKKGIEKYWPEQIEEKIDQLLYEDYLLGKNSPSSYTELKERAIILLTPSFLKDQNFIYYFQNDGGTLVEEYGVYHEDENRWTNQINMNVINKDLEYV